MSLSPCGTLASADELSNGVELHADLQASATAGRRSSPGFRSWGTRAVAPDHDWSFINRLASKVRARTVLVRDKRAKLATTMELLGLGLDLMESAQHQSTPRLAAIAYRDGLIIALLALRPQRRRNLARLVLGDTLVQVGGAWMLLIPPDETKAHQPINMPWPAALADHLGVYLAVHRPVLDALKSRWARPIGDALWVSSHGSPMTQMALYDQIRQRTHEGLGKDVNPHLFRDAAATTLCVEDPQHVRLATPLLGQRHTGTTERHYQQAQTLEAHRQFVYWLGRSAESIAAADKSGHWHHWHHWHDWPRSVSCKGYTPVLRRRFSK